MTRKFLVSIFSFSLIVHSAIWADTTQLMVDQEGNTIKLRCEESTALFDDVVSEIAAACEMATSEVQPPTSFTESQYWSLIHYKSHPDYYLTVFRAQNRSDDATMNQMLNCSSTAAQGVIVNHHDIGLSRLWLLTLTPLALFVAAMGVAAIGHIVHYTCHQNTIHDATAVSKAQLKPAITSDASSTTISKENLDSSIGVM